MSVKKLAVYLKEALAGVVLTAGLSLTLQTHAFVTEIQWSGSLSEVVTDTSGIYSGSAEGTNFSGTFNYGEVLSQTDYGLPNEFYYNLDFQTARIESNGVTRAGSFLELDIFSDFVCGSYASSPSANLFSCETHSNIAGYEVNEGSLLDGWFLYSVFTENNKSLFFAIDFLSRDPNLYSDLGFRRLPPFGLDTNDPDISTIFWVYEIDNLLGELTYGAWGSIDNLSIEQVPLPAGFWLLCSALTGMTLLRAKSKNRQ